MSINSTAQRQNSAGGFLHALKRLLFLRMVLALIAFCFCGPACYSQSIVRLTAKPTKVFSGQKVGIFQLDQGTKKFKFVTDKVTFDRNGICQFQLVKGTYRFEVFDTSQADLVCVRSRQIEVSDSAIGMELRASRMILELEHDGDPFLVTALGVQSLNHSRSVFRKMEAGKKRVRLNVSPDSELQLFVAGKKRTSSSSGDAVSLAGRFKVKSCDRTTLQAKGDWKSCRFAIHPDNPKITRGMAELQFPDGVAQMDITKGAVLITNFPAFQYRYSLQSDRGKRLVSKMAITKAQDQNRILTGGKLTPLAHAEVLWKDNNEFRLNHGVTLNDPAGREIDSERSSVDRTLKAWLGSDPIPTDPLSKEQRITLQNPSATMKFEFAWHWKDKRAVELRPSRWMRFDSERFTIDAPAGWADRANIYLSQLEATSRAIKENTGRGGPRMTEIHWRLNTHNAKARVGGDLSWMSMPVDGLINAKSAFDQPWFISHEMLHTFGFHHGEEMDGEVGKAESVFHGNHFETNFDASEGILDQLASTDIAIREKIKITNAKFGAKDKWADVTQQVRAVWNSRSQILICNLRQMKAGDPIPGVGKQVLIDYEIDGKSKSAKFGEYWVVDLGESLK